MSAQWKARSKSILEHLSFHVYGYNESEKTLFGKEREKLNKKIFLFLKEQKNVLTKW